MNTFNNNMNTSDDGDVDGRIINTVHNGTTDGVNDDDNETEMVMTLTPTATTNIATIEQGGFVNDVAFQRSRQEGDGNTMVGAYGTVITTGEDDSDIMTWDVDALRKHLKSKPEMERNIKFCLSDHLVKSLLRQREAAHKRERQGQQQQRRQLLQLHDEQQQRRQLLQQQDGQQQQPPPPRRQAQLQLQ
jgi:hypothetical protein